jgi:hypothetical protein
LIRQDVSSFGQQQLDASRSYATRPIEAVNAIGRGVPSAVTIWWTARLAIDLYAFYWRVYTRSHLEHYAGQRVEDRG